jgi:formylmethanofuran dehydrogenase subunit E
MVQKLWTFKVQEVDVLIQIDFKLNSVECSICGQTVYSETWLERTWEYYICFWFI